MPLTLRLVKGSALSFEELDSNFIYLSSSYVPLSATSSMTVLSSSYSITAITSSYPIAVTGSTLYSTNPASTTPNPSVAEYSIFLGALAGSGATSASYSNFLGNNAGLNATNANNSNFVGLNAGSNSTNASNSNFLGYNAGYQAANSSNSNFLGVSAGENATNAYYSNFLGANAGAFAGNAFRSNFLGVNAGNSATNASYSNFIGNSAGSAATNAINSNFLGRSAGSFAINASYSNLFGYQVGYAAVSAGIGTNNIIIGTNITLQDNRRDSINLGGIIFATGSYSTTTGNPFSGAMTTAKVGINKSLPDYTLDVSGSGNYSNGLDVTGSVNITGSLLLNGSSVGSAFPYTGSAQITGSLGITGSVAITRDLDVKNVARTVDLTTLGNIYPGVAATSTPVKYNGNDFADYHQSQFPSIQPYLVNSYSTSDGGTSITVRTGNLGIGTYIDEDYNGSNRRVESIYLYVSQSRPADASLYTSALSVTRTIISDNNTLLTPTLNSPPTLTTLLGISTANGRTHVLTITGSMLARDGVSLGTNISNTHFITGSTAITGSVTIDSVLKLQRRTTTPTSPEEGMIIASGSAGASILYYYNGSTWNALF